ncbi:MULTISPECIES: MarR family winged helix-turn-helix transcriptional regulator [unclassified Microbacterium]|uniref:MarR family winged helix-turn-helix transcriptional regulator n=1 Tax=unclassified Microbacterium TaxID=2609290 RepID=UPI00214C0510|nr:MULTISPECIES: MarR family winged helix-turn-helix transcriptional regulator [unclassified Microbacterium]MCR2784613.1 MarR family winged helix-turn-helix transcriptional regulator [Microbacterium sp. zg.B96]WIM16156.1 MarR family winged helix-turn-helix transcriptional regulator [Microbacterium sp. zg-B96]
MMHAYPFLSNGGAILNTNTDAAEQFAHVADLIVDIAREMRLRSGVDAPGVPLNQTQSQVMRFVHSCPDSSVSEIALAVGIKRTNVSSALQDLRELGYVTTAPDPRDGRAIRVRPTALADRTIAQLGRAWAGTLQEAWDAVEHGRDDIAAAESVLAALMQGLRATRHDGPGTPH